MAKGVKEMQGPACLRPAPRPATEATGEMKEEPL